MLADTTVWFYVKIWFQLIEWVNWSSNKLNAIAIETSYCFLSLFNPQQYTQAYMINIEALDLWMSLLIKHLNLVLHVTYMLHLWIESGVVFEYNKKLLYCFWVKCIFNCTVFSMFDSTSRYVSIHKLIWRSHHGSEILRLMVESYQWISRFWENTFDG